MLVRAQRWPAGASHISFVFGRDISRRVGVRDFGVCGRDLLVFGVVSRRAASVRVLAAGGEVVEARLFDPANGSRVRGRYYVAALPEHSLLSRVESVDAAGNTLARRSIEDQFPGPCDR